MQTKINEINIKDSYTHLLEYFARFDFDYFVFTITASIICFIGIMMDSPSVIIGSMVLSPLLYPVIAIAVSLYLRDWHVLLRKMFLLLIGFLCVVFLASLLSLFWEVDFQSGEIVERINSNVTLYFIIAFISGFAGMFCFLWPKALEAMTGVAISIALLPPLVILGIAIVQSNELVNKALSIVTINTFGILLGALIVLFPVRFFQKILKN